MDLAACPGVLETPACSDSEWTLRRNAGPKARTAHLLAEFHEIGMEVVVGKAGSNVFEEAGNGRDDHRANGRASERYNHLQIRYLSILKWL